MKENKIKNLMNLFFDTTRMIKRHLSDCGGGIDHVSWLQLHAVAYVDQHAPTVSELGSFLKIARPSTTSLVNTLVRQRFVKKIKEKKDARSVRLEILSAGKKFLQAGQSKMAANLEPILSQLTDSELSHFIAIHKRLQQIIETSNQ